MSNPSLDLLSSQPLDVSLNRVEESSTFTTLESLDFLRVDDLHEIILESHMASSSRPSLYTIEKEKMVEASDYHFDFLNDKRPSLALASPNADLREAADSLSVQLKEKIEQTIAARSLKVFRKTLPDFSELGQSNLRPNGLSVSEESELKISIARFQEGYQKLMADMEDFDNQFWINLIENESDRQGLRSFWKHMSAKYNGNLKEFDQIVHKALFGKTIIGLFCKDEKNKITCVTKTREQLIQHFSDMQQQRAQKFEKLCEQWMQSTNNEILLKKFVKLEAESIHSLFEELRGQHHLHSLSRFQRLMNCHSQFINGMTYLFQAIEKRCVDKEAIRGVVSEMISNASKDPTKEKSATSTGFYRDIQGRASDKTLSKADHAFNAKMGLIFKKALRTSLFIERADAHTMPFPAVFSWSPEKLEQKLKSHSISANSGLTKKRLTKEAYSERDKKLIVQEAVDRLGVDLKSDTGQFIWEAMIIIVELGLREASETELFPVFINKNLDGLSEVKLADKELLKTISVQTSPLESDYKVMLGKSLNHLLDLKREVEPTEVFEANKGYMRQILHCLKYRINELTSKTSVGAMSLDKMYELRLICDIWAVLNQVEAEYGQPIDSSIQVDWKQLQQWSKVTV